MSGGETSTGSVCEQTSCRETVPKGGTKPIKHALQIYDYHKGGYPLAVFEVQEPFMDIRAGDTMDGGGWPRINTHAHYAKVYRVMSVRHTIKTSADGVVTHLKSLFVEPVI